MTKRKLKIETASEETPVERVYKAGGQAEVLDQSWDIAITPQWRTQILISTDEPQSLDDAQRYATQELFKYVVAAYPTVRMTPALDWRQTDTDTWVATGNDGVEETTLPLVTITRVGGAE